MICVYAREETDFSGNGIALLHPAACEVSEEAGGSYELTLTHPITDDLRWKTITEGCVIKAPVPAVETPDIRLVKDGIPAVPATPDTPEIPAVIAQPERIIWKVRITTQYAGGYSRIYERPASESRVLQKLRNGTEYEYLGPVGYNWHKAVSKKGTKGYMFTDNSIYVRTEPEILARPAVPAKPGRKAIPAVPGYSTVVGPRQIREQLFRVYEVQVDSASGMVTANARHISFDLAGNLCGKLKMKRVPLPIALNRLRASLITPDERQLISNAAPLITGEWNFENGIKVLLDPEEGIAKKARCQLVRDNWDFFLLNNMETDRGVSISYGKNLRGVKWSTNDEAVATRLVPVGQDKNGNPVILPEKYINSPLISAYPTVRTRRLDVSDAREGKDVTLQQVYTELRQAAQKALNEGCDQVAFTLEVDFLNLGDTVEYREFAALQQVHLYDTVTIRHAPLGLTTRAQARAYSWDALLMRYNSISLGNVFEVSAPGIASYELPAWGVGGGKIAPGAVDSGQLRDLAVVAAKIGLGEIQDAHIENATIQRAKISQALIDSLKADSLEAVRAHIRELVADNLTADQLYADLASITLAQLTTANITQANIAWADIETLRAAMIDAFRSRIEYLVANNLVSDELYAALAEITQLQVATADIDWGRIKDLVTDTAIITQGTAGELFISRLAVTEANIVSLAVGELMVRGVDGGMYTLTVDEEGTIITVPSQVTDGDLMDAGAVIDEENKVIYQGITAQKLDVQDIFAENAVINSLIAANLRVDELFAREGTIAALNTQLLKTDSFIQVMETASAAAGELQANKDYIRFGKLINSSGEQAFGISIGSALQVDANGNVTQESASQQSTGDRTTFRHNGVVVMELRDGGVNARRGNFDEVTVKKQWKQAVDSNGTWSLMWVG